MADYNPDDPEECDACYEVGDLCTYHIGFDAGFRYAFEIVNKALEDPESVVGALRRRGL